MIVEIVDNNDIAGTAKNIDTAGNAENVDTAQWSDRVTKLNPFSHSQILDFFLLFECFWI